MPLSIYLTIGKYLPGASAASIAVYDAATGSSVTLTSATCSESGTDLFGWSTSNITTQPTARTEYYYTITPNTGSAKQGRFTLLTYADILMLERLLRTDRNNIRVGIVSSLPANTQSDIGHDDMSEFLREADAYIDAMLGRHYSTPLGLTDNGTKRLIQRIATQLAGYNIFSAMYPNVSRSDLSSVVKGWREEADKMLENIGKGLITLAGETLATGSPQAGYPLFGKPTILFPEVGNSETTGVVNDADISTN